MRTPFSVTAALKLPADVGLPPDPIPVAFSSGFDSASEFVLNLDGDGTQTVPLGTMAPAGAKGLLIKVDANEEGAAVNVLINGSEQGIEIAPGGFFLYGNPAPVSGIAQLDLVHTTSNIVRVWALG
jgi:hypothetical protein